MQMCRDRGFLIEDNECTMTEDGFKDTFGSKPSEDEPKRSEMNVVVENEHGESLGLFFPDEQKVGRAAVRQIVESMTDNDMRYAIVVVRVGMTPSAKKALQSAGGDTLQIQSFTEAELMVNITEHELVPKHELLTPEEKIALIKRYKLKEQQIPRIKVSDPVAKYHGLRRGQIVKITRDSPTAGRYVTYRIVH